MEKLIIEHATFNSPKKMCTINGCGEVTNRSSCGKMCREIEGACSKCPIMEVFERLADYESTDLTPEQIRKIDRLYLDRLREIEDLKRQLLNGSSLCDCPNSITHSIGEH